MNQYFIPIAVGACGLTLFLSLSLYAAINRGSGRVIATQPTTETQDEAPKRGDDRREKKNYRIVRINRYGRNRTAVSPTLAHPENRGPAHPESLWRSDRPQLHSGRFQSNG